MMKKRNTLFIITLTLAAAAMSGCAAKNPRNTVFVEGTVTLDGKPVSDVNVNFCPRGSEYSAGGLTDSNGRFMLTTGGSPAGSGARAGEYDVTFSKTETEGSDLSPEEWEKKFANRQPQTIYIVPQHYGNVKTSGIEPVIVRAGEKNTFTFELKSGPPEK